VVSDSWEGLDNFFEPGREIMVASSSSEVVDAITKNSEELLQIGKAARERVLSAHTADHRSREFVELMEAAV
jgi:spore maturation protein CgeB